MRIILWLATVAAAASIGAAASAQPGTATISRSGGSNGASTAAGRGPGFHGPRPFRPGLGKGPRRHRGRLGHHGPDRVYLYGPGGIAGPFDAIDPHGIGFFAGGGGRVRVEGGRPNYDYDRSYPYEWAAATGPASVWVVQESGLPSLPSCDVEKGVRVCRGGR